MGWNALLPAGMPAPVAPYSLGAETNDGWVVTAGLVAIDEAGATVGKGDIKAQTQHVLELIRRVLAEAGGGFKDIVSMQIFIKDYADYQGMNEVYREVLGKDGGKFPPRYCIRADLVKEDWLIEMVAVAKVGSN